MKQTSMKTKDVTIFYNSENYDCYTAVFKKNGDVYGFNPEPFAPYGFVCYIRNVLDRFSITYGPNWRNHLDEKKMLKSELKNYLSEAKSNPRWLGIEIPFSDLFENAQKYVKQLMED